MKYNHAKQKGEVKSNQLLVPFGGPVCFGTYVVRYLELFRKNVTDYGEDQPLFVRATRQGLGRQPMGENQLGEIGKTIAKELGLQNPQTYTGHAFRRSAATEAANKGATGIIMKRQLGWVSEQTSNKYIHSTKECPRKFAEFVTGVKVAAPVPKSASVEPAPPEQSPIMDEQQGTVLQPVNKVCMCVCMYVGM